MADEKFSQFPAVADPAGGEVVGLSAGDNARFPASAFATAAQGAKADTAVQSVAATNGTIVMAGTPTAPAVARAAITGDVTIPAGSNAATVVTNANLTGDVTSVGNATAIAAGVIVNADVSPTAAIDATKLADGSVTNAELQFINTLSSNAQTQLNGKIDKTAFTGIGEILVGTGAGTYSPLPPGSNGQLLEFNTAAPLDVQWVPPPAGGSPLTTEVGGVPQSTATTLYNFVGAGVVVTEPVANEFDITIAGGGGSLTIEANTVDQPAEPALNFTTEFALANTAGIRNTVDLSAANKASLDRADTSVQSVIAEANNTILVSGTLDDVQLARAAISGDVSIPANSNTATISALAATKIADGSVTNSEFQTLSDISTGSTIQAQLNTKAPIASPTFTGTVTAPTLNTTTINSGTLSGNNSGDNAPNTLYSGLIQQSITDGVTTSAPSQNVVFDALVQKLNTPLLAGMNATDPIRILSYGDSNHICTGGFTTANGTIPANANVEVFDTGETSTYTPGLLQWRVIDQTGASKEVSYNAAVTANTRSFSGSLAGNNGMTCMELADYVQKANPNRKVYVYATGKGGIDSTYWLPTTGQGMNTMVLEINGALSSIPGSGGFAFSTFDIVYYSGGANDMTLGVTPATFEANTQTTIDFMVTQGWVDKNRTLFFHPEASQWWMKDSPNALQPNWTGFVSVAAAMGPRWYGMSTETYTYLTGTFPIQLHYAGAVTQQIGRDAAQMALKGIQPKTIERTGQQVLAMNGTAYKTNVQYSPYAAPIITEAAVPQPWLSMVQDIEWDVTAAGANAMASAIRFGGTHSIANRNGFVFGMGQLFVNNAIFQNKTGQTFAPSGFATLASTETYRANGQNITLASNPTSIFVNPTFDGVGGTLNGGNYTAYWAQATVGNQATLPRYTAYFAGTGSESGATPGILTTQIGFHCGAMTAANNNISMLLGTGTVPNGNWNLFQGDTKTTRFNGGFITPTRVKTLADGVAVTVVVGDRNIILATGSTGDVDLPAIATMMAGLAAGDFALMQGWQVTVKNWRAGSVTVTAGTGNTFHVAGMNTIATNSVQNYTFVPTSSTVGVWY